MASHSFTEKALLQHGEFMRRLARVLVVDENEAEELVQETWLLALSDDLSTITQPRAWLAAVMRRVKWTRHRGELRRRVREKAQPSRCSASDTSDEVEQLEMQQRVVQEVLSLPTSERDVVLLNYYHDFSLAELSDRTGAPVSTVRKRLRRAHERLRSRLDKECGDRATWCVVLTALHPEPSPVVPPSLSAWTLSVGHKSLLALLFAVLAGVHLTQPNSRPLPTVPTPEAQLASKATAAPQKPPTLAAATRQTVPLGSQLSGELLSNGKRLPEGWTEIRGRFFLSGGQPASGVEFELGGSPEGKASSGRLDPFESPSAPQPLYPLTDSGGALLVRLKPLPECSYYLRVKAPRHLSIKVPSHEKCRWDWPALKPGYIELGDTTIERPGSIRCRIVDTKERELVDGWTVKAYWQAATTAGSEQERRVSMEAGGCLIEGLPPREIQLEIHHAGVTHWRGVPGPTVAVEAGVEKAIDIVFDGPDPSARIFVKSFSAPFFILGHNIEEFSVNGPAFEGRAPGSHSHGSAYAFDGVPPGNYVVEVNDPRFRPWMRGDVKPGEVVSAELVGSATVWLDLRYEASGERVERFRVRARYMDDGPTWDMRSFSELIPDPESGRIEGLIPGDMTLLIEVPGMATLELPVDGLLPDETRALKATINPGLSVRGRVLKTEGSIGVAGATIHLQRGAAARATSNLGEQELQAQVTNQTGAFEYPHLTPGFYSLFATIGQLVTPSQEIELGVHSNRELIELRLPPFGGLDLRLLTPPGTNTEELFLQLAPTSKSQGAANLEAMASDEDGLYRMRHIPSGEMELSLIGPAVSVPKLRRTSIIHRGLSLSLGSIHLTPGEILEREIDIRDRWPGELAIRVLRNGKPMAGAVVSVADKSDGEEPTNAAISNSQGWSVVRGLLPGEYKVSVRSAESTWQQHLPGLQAVSSNQRTISDWETGVSHHSLSLLDRPTGKPLASTWLYFRGCQRDRVISRKTDAQGRLELQLPSGACRIHRQPFSVNEPEPKGTEFLWPPDDSAVSVLSLP